MKRQKASHDTTRPFGTQNLFVSQIQFDVEQPVCSLYGSQLTEVQDVKRRLGELVVTLPRSESWRAVMIVWMRSTNGILGQNRSETFTGTGSYAGGLVHAQDALYRDS